MCNLKSGKGIIICGGGYKYFSNAYLSLRFIRASGCLLPVEIWIWDFEHSTKLQELLKPFGASFKVVPAPARPSGKLPKAARWQWVLKPHALLNTDFRHVIFLDADNFAIVDPSFLFDSAPYQETGALFWPDVDGQVMAKREIWDVMGIPFRQEREFESGQMVIDTVRHRDPLEFALKMNQESEKYYHLIWGDKDTFRFAWHKYGRSFAMTPWSLQMLTWPGVSSGGGAMCQHDFHGRRIFQHRNLAKWDLLGNNPRIPGYFYEDESRQFLAELREKWNGRLNWTAPRRKDFEAEAWKERCRLVKDLVQGKWLLDDRRPSTAGCCGPPLKWSSKSISKTWERRPVANSADAGIEKLPLNKPMNVLEKGHDLLPGSRNAEHGPGKDAAANPSKPVAIDPAYGWSRGLKCREVAFAEDSTLREGASPEAYWWDLEQENSEWVLFLLNEKGRVARMTRTADQGWFGRWLKKPGGVVGLKRLEAAFPFSKAKSGFSQAWMNLPKSKKPIHQANHAYGIGDAVTGLYAAAAMAQLGQAVVYHTRFARWLRRASHPLISVTEAVPPRGTRDMDTDYAEQIRYAADKVAWYAGQAGWKMLSPHQTRTFAKNKLKGDIAIGKNRMARKHSGSLVNSLEINRSVGIPRLDFPKYVLLAPFAAWEARDWPETHWRRLAWLLKEAGYEIVAIGIKTDAERMERVFNKSYAYWAIDHEPEWVMDAMLDAEAVIGLDSGMIHLAGLLGVPAVCIHAHLTPEFLFSHAPTVKSVTPEASCVFCRWQEDRGFMEGCATACSAMALVGPQQVMEALESEEMIMLRQVRATEKIKLETNLASCDAEQNTAFIKPTVEAVEKAADVIAYTYKHDCGLGEAAAANIRAMREIGLTVEHRIWEGQIPRETALQNPDQIYYHHWHPQVLETSKSLRRSDFGAARHIAFWAWEAEGPVPPGFGKIADFFSELWVPSKYCEDIFTPTGRPIYVIPHAVESVSEEPQLLPRQREARPLTILTLFDAWSHLKRKNPIAAIRVFQRAFHSRFDVRLIIKAHNISESELIYLSQFHKFDSRITLVNKFLSEAELEVYFANADVLLSLQRSEGFGLNLAKALARGIPLVTTGYGGQMDFCESSNTHLVPWKYLNISKGADAWYPVGKWAEPNERAAAIQLRRLANRIDSNDNELIEMRRRGWRKMRDEFGNKNLCERIRKRIPVADGNRNENAKSKLYAM